MAKFSKDAELLPYALAGLVQRRDEIIAKIAEIRAQLAGGVSAAPSGKGSPAATKKRGRRQRTMSAEARSRIAEAQRKRWAASRKGTPAASAAGSTKKKGSHQKRTLSAEARARIAEAQRQRWAAVRKGK